MASSLRPTINKLCKQLQLINLSSSPVSKVRLSACGFTVPNRTKYSASKKNFIARTKIQSLALEDNFDEEGTVLEEAEDHLLEHGIGSGLSNTDRQLRKDRYRLKMAIIRRKYFKPEQETSLLTWEAKEQIRFLHQHTPDIWTVKKLAESYPCSESGIEKILESTYRPRNEAEIEHHNRRTRKNWLALQSLLKDKGRSEAVSKFQHVLDENKLPLMINAGGINGLPSPASKSKQGNPDKSEHVGKFESIIKSYKEKTLVKTAGNDVNQKLLQSPSDEKLLLSIVNFDMAKSGSVETTAVSCRPVETDTFRYGASSRNADKNLQQHATLKKGRTSNGWTG
ncbi:uncharacterized protein LOC135473881 [Liolophura sinensis]|uniref:uncharacterized protein LOC135473881 n=1 Tax=Liolophura sinensis TaxID=3198878 RepID=UPI003158B734